MTANVDEKKEMTEADGVELRPFANALQEVVDAKHDGEVEDSSYFHMRRWAEISSVYSKLRSRQTCHAHLAPDSSRNISR